MRFLLAMYMTVAALIPMRAEAYEDALVAVFGEQCNQDPCIIRYSGGGRIDQFTLALRNILDGLREHVVFDGACYSSCALLADAARASGRICVTPNVEFGFHKGEVIFTVPILDVEVRKGERFDPQHSADIDGWVKEKGGGYPSLGLLVMKYKDAKRFWPSCSFDSRPPPPRGSPVNKLRGRQRGVMYAVRF